MRRYSNMQALRRQLPEGLDITCAGLAFVRWGIENKCTVTLRAHPQRPEAFKDDGNLAASLVRRCERLQLGGTPGFAANAPQGVMIGYSPWANSERRAAP